MVISTAARPVPARGQRGGFWDAFLVFGLGAAVTGGLVLAVAPDSPLLGWLNAAVNEAFFPAGQPPGVAALRRWLYAVEGSTLAAFGLLGLFIARTAFRRRERWARNALAVAVLVWFPLDTAASLSHGVWQNAALNAAIAVLLLAPVVALWQRFPGARTEPRPGAS